ncbi:DNA fragmentation factor subunit alpha isoform X3 [Ahaetulla prasina]|uniref:DNA fragmentation factor subunit alpha isoform X3 n=1 Tax=Ahaetulla prasina TaxID=499056 RepID=UPI00264808ED|nr:DNA fragmentation factor subunit alpha isoform X3 [Ahaetulla prasina]
MAESGSRLPRLKRCLIRRMGQREEHGVAASTLQELKMKACHLLAIGLASQPVTLVLAEDGTIIDDDDYFGCLPPDTKFGVVAKNEQWTSTGEGTTWLGEEMTNTNEVDSGGEKWKVLARQLKKDLSTIVLMSEEDLQALVEVPCSDLARELSENPLQTQRLQATLQETLDRREEERRSRQLLELYLQAIKKEDQATSTAQETQTLLFVPSIRRRGKIRGRNRYCRHGEQRPTRKDSAECPRRYCAERKACPRTQPGQSRLRAGLQRRFRRSFSGPTLGQTQDRSLKGGVWPGAFKATAAISLSKFTEEHLQRKEKTTRASGTVEF